MIQKSNCISRKMFIYIYIYIVRICKDVDPNSLSPANIVETKNGNTHIIQCTALITLVLHGKPCIRQFFMCPHLPNRENSSNAKGFLGRTKYYLRCEINQHKVRFFFRFKVILYSYLILKKMNERITDS